MRMYSTNINADVYTHIEMRVKNNTPGTAWRMYFDPAGSAGEGGNSVSFTVNSNNTWQTVTIDMTADADWQGTIDRIRLDPQGYVNGTIDIDYIKVISPSGGNNGGQTHCISYSGTSLTELTLNDASCITVADGLTNKEISIADSDANSSCDIRGSASSKDGTGYHVIDGNWEKISGGWTGTAIQFDVSNNCKYLKLRVR